MGARINFICTGNICRSPLAEAVARDMFDNLGLTFTSAGLHSVPGHGASQGSADFGDGLGLSLDNHASRPIDPDELVDTAWVIGMTRSHAAMFRSRFGHCYQGKIGVLGAAGINLADRRHSPELEEVDDPYGLSEETYQATGRQIQRLLAGWRPEFEKLSERNGEPDMKIAIGSDHRGFPHKSLLVEHLTDRGIAVEDFGCHSAESADYPDAALPVAEMVGTGQADAGVLICGSGIGMSIAANKVRGVRASLCFTEDQARTTRQHNDSNVLCLSGDGVTPNQAVALLDTYLSAEFEGDRHGRRVDKIIAWENSHMKQE